MLGVLELTSVLIGWCKCWQGFPLPDSSPVACLATATDTAWILTTTGKIYIRQGVTDKRPDGRTWKELNLIQLGKYLCYWRLILLGKGLSKD